MIKSDNTLAKLTKVIYFWENKTRLVYVKKNSSFLWNPYYDLSRYC